MILFARQRGRENRQTDIERVKMFRQTKRDI